MTLEPGDTISIFTDGVTDALNADDKMFGPDERSQRVPDRRKTRTWLMAAGRSESASGWSTRFASTPGDGRRTTISRSSASGGSRPITGR